MIIYIALLFIYKGHVLKYCCDCSAYNFYYGFPMIAFSKAKFVKLYITVLGYINLICFTEKNIIASKY